MVNVRCLIHLLGFVVLLQMKTRSNQNMFSNVCGKLGEFEPIMLKPKSNPAKKGIVMCCNTNHHGFNLTL